MASNYSHSYQSNTPRHQGQPVLPNWRHENENQGTNDSARPPSRSNQRNGDIMQRNVSTVALSSAVPVQYDELLHQEYTVNNNKCTITAYLTCRGQELFAIESDRKLPGYGDGRCPICNSKHLSLPSERGFYAPASKVFDTIQKRKLEEERHRGPRPLKELPGISQSQPPLDRPVTGNDKGIEGDSNSCYMDATIFCMFAYTGVFDTLLNKQLSARASDLQKILRENVVNVLRGPNGVVTRDAMYHLRVELSRLTKDQSFIEQEKDPSEFLKVLERDFEYTPLKTINGGQRPTRNFSNTTTNIVWEMFDPNIEKRLVTSIADIFRNSLKEIPAQLATIPPVLILIAPRHERTKRSYPYIIPDREIVLNNDVLQIGCVECNRTNYRADESVQFFSCDRCLPKSSSSSTDAVIQAFCSSCLASKHKYMSRSDLPNHAITEIKAEKHKMNLFAVLCIEACHYVAFVKCSQKNGGSEWLFFDSMSDRIHNEKNIPSVSRVPSFDQWLDQAEKNRYFFEDLDNLLRRDSRPMSQKFDETAMRQLRLFRDGAFFFYENADADYL